jgi:ABC-type spermidine/putrescine transport system permease subunit II
MITIKWYGVAFATFITLLFMMNVLIITRIHYTIDIMGGIIFALAFHRGVSYTLKYFDYLFSIPFYIGRYFYKRLCKGKDEDD